MILRRFLTVLTLAICVLLPHLALAHDGNYLALGRNANFGRSGTGAALWFIDENSTVQAIDPAVPIPIFLAPNVVGPSGAGQLYAELPTDVITRFDAALGRIVNVLASAKIQRTTLQSGIELYLEGGDRVFSANTDTAPYNNAISYPVSGGWHLHFACRAWRPGVYDFQFKLTNVVARDGTALSDSPVYTLRFINRPTAAGRIQLEEWLKTDSSPNLTGNSARAYLFPANSTPIRESEALAKTDVFLDNAGTVLLPSFLVADGTYRLGIKPLSAPGLAKLVPGNVTLTTTALPGVPPNVGTLILPLGDANRDGSIDVFDLDTLILAFDAVPGDTNWKPEADFNGDNAVDVLDLDLLIRHFDMSADFLP